MPRIRKSKKPYVPSLGGLCPDGVDPYEGAEPEPEPGPYEPQQLHRREVVAQDKRDLEGQAQRAFLAQVAPTASRFCKVTVKIELEDENGARTVIEPAVWASSPKDAIRFIRRHTGYDPLA